MIVSPVQRTLYGDIIMNQFNALKLTCGKLTANGLDERLQCKFGLCGADIGINISESRDVIYLPLQLIDLDGRLAEFPHALPRVAAMIEALIPRVGHGTMAPVAVELAFNPHLPEIHPFSETDPIRAAGIVLLRAMVSLAVARASNPPQWGFGDE